MESKRVVVTGLGAITPIGNTIKDFWEGLVNGKNGAGEITRFDSTLFKTHFACEVKGYNPDDYFDKKTSPTLLGRSMNNYKFNFKKRFVNGLSEYLLIEK